MNAAQINPKKSLLSRKLFWLSIVGVIAIVGISYATINSNFQSDPLEDRPTYEVQQGQLTISVSVAGTIQAREKVIIKSELEGSNTILYLIPEGSQVEQGELLVELDASSLIDEQVEQEIRVQNAEADFINARENLAITKSQAQSDIDQAQLAFDFAQQDLKKYVEGEFPKLKKEAETQITLREEELNQAQEELKWSEILYEEKYLSQTELQNDQLAANRIQLQLELAQTDLELLNDFTYQRELAQLKSDVRQAEMALERTKRSANASIVQASAALQADEAEYEQQKSKLQKIIDQIAKSKIYAPMDGLVVYATSVQMSWRGNDEPLDEGQQIRERQELIHLPTTSSYMAEVKVHESSLEKIYVGLPVRIKVDALPGKTYTGKVATIAPLPDPQSVFMNPDLKVYKTQIQVESDSNELRSGMSCQAEIIVDHFEDTEYIPVQAVVRIKNQPHVYVKNGANFDPRPVEIGPDNNRLIQIASGLEPGEKVLLAPPLQSTQMSQEQDQESSSEMADLVNEAKREGIGNRDAQPARNRPQMQGQGEGNQRPQGGGNRGGGRPQGGQ